MNMKLTDMTANCGCSAKLPQGLLSGILDRFPKPQDPNLIVGFHTRDDACVYQLDERTMLVQTLDFFTPIVDDPFLYGQIAAANALSDVFAMGADPKLALNILCIPSDMDASAVAAILDGGYQKVLEAGALLTGGHTIEDAVPKYGLSVTGFARPDEILLNSKARPGDVLILTKPLGTGILSAAHKLGLAERKAYDEMTASMSCLNKTAKDIMTHFDVHACTDITGFGFLGHLLEMTSGSETTAEIRCDLLPTFPTVLAHAAKAHAGGAVYRNLKNLDTKVTWRAKVGAAMRRILADPQTSGGLLIAADEKCAQQLLRALKDALPYPCVVGHMTPKKEAYIELT